jgi:hypothetical protein
MRPSGIGDSDPSQKKNILILKRKGLAKVILKTKDLTG